MTPNSILFPILQFLLLSSVASNNLQDFVNEKLANYSSWLISNNFDPSPPEIGRRQFGLTEENAVVNSLRCNITEMVIEGHSIEPDVKCSETDLFRGVISMRSEYKNIVFHGKYSATGTVFSSIPVNSQGNWSIRIPTLNLHKWWMIFKVTTAGYINITSVRGFYDSSASRDGDLHFENLLDNPNIHGYEDFVKSALFDAFWDNFLHQDGAEGDETLNKLQSLCPQYLQEIFAVTPLSEIIGPTGNQPFRKNA